MKIRFRHVMLAIVIIAVAAVIIVTGRGGDTKRETPPLTPDSSSLEIPVPVIGLKANPGEFREVHSVTGIIEAFHRTHISSEIGGRVMHWTAELGVQLKAGDVILQLDDELALLSLDQAEANLESARVQVEKYMIDWERAQQLSERGDISRNQYESIELALRGSEAAFAAAQAGAGFARRNLRETQVRMPFDGSISAKVVEVGQNIPPGASVAEVVQVIPVKLLAGVPEEDVVRLKISQQVTVRTVGWGEEKFRGIINSIGVAADPASRLFPVEIIISNDDRRLKPGMAAVAEIQLAKYNNAIIVPRQALRFVDEKTHLFIVNGGIAVREEISYSKSNDESVMVEEGVSAGDTIIVTGHKGLKPGQKVKLSFAEDR